MSILYTCAPRVQVGGHCFGGKNTSISSDTDVDGSLEQSVGLRSAPRNLESDQTLCGK